jgi:hypothetical protein
MSWTPIEPIGEPQKPSNAGKGCGAVMIVFVIIVVAVLVFAIGSGVYHYLTTPAHTCYDQFSGGVTTCH